MNTSKLAKRIEGCSDGKFILHGFQKGFALGVKDNPSLAQCSIKKGSPSEVFLDKLKSEVHKGRIIGPFLHKPPGLQISPLHVIPKPGSSKVRMIFNLYQPVGKSVNDNILEARKPVKYCSVHEVGQHLLSFSYRKAWLAKVDLTDAYRMVPIRKRDWKYLGMAVNGRYFIDRMLPMGASSSCQLFQRISNSLKEMFYKYCPVEAQLFNYLDDFLFVAFSKENCEVALHVFEELCQELNLPLAEHKTIPPCTLITFLGLGINAQTLTLYIPHEKIKSSQEKLKKFLSKKKQRVREWQSLAGSLNYLAQVVSAGRTFLGSVYGSLSGSSQTGSGYRKISSEVRQDLMVWNSLLAQNPERPFKILDMTSSTLPPLYTDASTSVGFGGMCGSKWFWGAWPRDRHNNIAVLELYPIVLGVYLLFKTETDNCINIYTDNKALVPVLNKLYSKDVTLRKLLRPLVAFLMTRNLAIVAHHISGEKNVGPDLLSRGKLAVFKDKFPHMASYPISIPEEMKFENMEVS